MLLHYGMLRSDLYWMILFGDDVMWGRVIVFESGLVAVEHQFSVEQTETA